jgi:hypothetical protein
VFTYLVSRTIIMWLISEENGKKGSYTCPCPITKKKKKCFSLILERKMPMGNLLTSFVQLEKQWELPSLNQTSDLSQEASCLARLQPTTQSSS